ncbi:MAG: exodeoxyribonuclease III [Campylobacter sp.]|nr:exodeoxyribonuclease III [Campylobacter sp.]MBR7047086.1 exodeoxyribonuclease III [Campylobacter sp.]
MRLISWNVNGLRAVVAKDGFAWLSGYKPDFLGIQETKLNEEQIPKEIYNLGFANLSANSATRAGYSGVMSLHNFPCVTHKSLFNDDTEGRVLQHDFKDITLFNIYFPNGQKDDERLKFKLEFYAKFLAYLDELRKNGRKIIICGDVNTAHREIDLKNPKANSQTSGFLKIEREWIDELLSHGFIDTFRAVRGDEVAYSWWSYRFNARAKNVGWRIDYFFISEDLRANLKDAFILSEITGSDHCPVGIDIEI